MAQASSTQITPDSFGLSNEDESNGISRGGRVSRHGGRRKKATGNENQTQNENQDENQTGDVGRGQGRGRGRGRGGRGGQVGQGDREFNDPPNPVLSNITATINNTDHVPQSAELDNPHPEKRLEERIEELQRALANEQAARQQAETNAATATAAAASAAAPNNLVNPPSDSQLIRKPRGSAGDGYCLIEEMGLDREKLSYNAVVATVHELCYGAGLDWQRTYSHQSKEKLVRIFEVGKSRGTVFTGP